jgi:hypothetical protein
MSSGDRSTTYDRIALSIVLVCGSARPSEEAAPRFSQLNLHEPVVRRQRADIDLCTKYWMRPLEQFRWRFERKGLPKRL